MKLEMYESRFTEIREMDLTQERKAIMYANLMTGMEQQYGGLNAIVNSEDKDLFELYGRISKARYE